MLYYTIISSPIGELCIIKSNKGIRRILLSNNAPFEQYLRNNFPNEKVIKHISECGINRFDVASINEIQLIKKILPKARVYYMNTVKNREHIRDAYLNFNIRDFVLDTKEELQKIIEATNNAKNLNLYIRVSISNEHAEIDLSQKFGALPSEALGLLRLAKAHAKKAVSYTHLTLPTKA